MIHPFPRPPPRRPAAPLACCLPAYFLTVIDSLLHTTLRDDDGALSCQALAIHFLKYACEKGEQRQRGSGGKGAKERRSEAKRHHYIGYALSSLPAYATPPTPCCCCCLPHSTHLQYVRVMRHKPPTRTHFLLFSQLKTLPSLALCFVHV